MRNKFILSVVCLLLLINFNITNWYNLNNESKFWHYDKIWDNTFSKLINDWNYIDFQDFKTNIIYKSNKYSKSSNWVTIDTWDYIVFHYKWSRYWNPFNKWNHVVIVNWDYLVEAISPWKNSRKILLSEFFSSDRMKDFDKMIIVNMNLSDKEKENIWKYIDNNLLWKPYPSKYFTPFTKYSMSTFYCSSLVWRAHMSSWKYVDLDDVSYDHIVWPVELVLSKNAWSKTAISIN